MTTPSTEMTEPNHGFWTRWIRRRVLDRLSALPSGSLSLYESGRRILGGSPSGVRIDVLDRDFYRQVALGGSIGAGESFMAGHWQVDDLTRLVQLFSRDPDATSTLEAGAARVAGWIDRAAHRLRRNTRRGSRRNIAQHYDLGNEFFGLFLDPMMMYSCALFPEDGSDLESASVHKLDVISRKLELQPGDEVVEIGTGWGGFAVHAAERYGCRVTTTTVSREQYDYATERVRAHGLEHQVEILLCDYRDLVEATCRRFDKLVSIEMIEAVGHSYLERYFEVCSRLLHPDGLGLLQAIVIADDRYEGYRRSADFIQRHVFPGGLLPSVSRMTAAMARATDLKLVHLEDITPHSARTLRCWRERFMGQLDRVTELGLPESFQRMWEFYLCYCEAGFLERVIGDVQVVLAKPLNRRAPIASALAPPTGAAPRVAEASG